MLKADFAISVLSRHIEVSLGVVNSEITLSPLHTKDTSFGTEIPFSCINRRAPPAITPVAQMTAVGLSVHEFQILEKALYPPIPLRI